MSVFARTLTALFGLLSLATATHAIEDTWHVAIGTGMSMLDPDTRGSGLSLVDDQSVVTGINLGLDINPVITTELGITNLGSASLSAGQSIDYQAISLGAVAYVWGEKEAHYRQEGLSAYVRLGFSAIDNESEVILRQSNNTAFWLGAGAQWPITRQFSVRGEFSSFDGDANTVMASLVWRNAGSRAPRIASNPASPVVEQTAADVATQADRESVQAVSEPTPEPVAVADPEPVVRQPLQQPETPALAAPEPAVRQPVEQPETQVAAAPVVAPQRQTRQPLPERAEIEESTTALANQNAAKPSAESRCFSTPMRGEISQSACSVLDGVLAGLDFKPDTSQITLLGKASLDRVASALKQYPLAVVELRTHTQSFSEAGLADRLSKERVVNVARYLASQGVSVQQLRARSYGSKRPLADNSTAAGRRANNRVEISLL